jgi:hypothetical protein
MVTSYIKLIAVNGMKTILVAYNYISITPIDTNSGRYKSVVEDGSD